jgi:hypothetical protein
VQISYSPESIKIKQNKNGTFCHNLHHRSEKGTEVMKITLLLNVHILYRRYVAHWQTNTFSNKKALPIVTTGNQMKVLGAGDVHEKVANMQIAQMWDVNFMIV